MLRNARPLPPAQSTGDRTSSVDSEPGPPLNGVSHEIVDRLAQDSRCLEGRLQALETVAELLKLEIEASTEQLRLLVAELESAEHWLGAEHPGGHRAPPRRATAGANGGRAPPPQERLAAREREVLTLLTEGMRSPCIAERLGIKTATVDVHRRNIMRKLNLHSVAALTKYALRTGLTSL